MGKALVRRRHSAFAAGLATLAMALGFTAIPADAAPREQVDYVALGDSYTAGTGAGAFPSAGTCIRTAGGYVDVVGKTGRVNLVANAACHGALLTQYSTIPHDPRIPNANQQIDSLITSRALTSSTELVSITAGANDVGVTGVLVTCLTQSPQACLAAVQTSAATFPKMQTDLVTVYQRLRTAAPNAEIVVLGYPRLFDPAIPFEQIDPAVLNAINAAVDTLNRSIQAAVEASGTDAVFVDVTDRFIGHEVNSADPWIFFRTPTVSSSGLVFDPRNFHPNKAGHRAYASALLAAVKPGQLVR
ncbi:lysophospholipase L1-like esterase [Pseudarthrobacter siccitolerans]|uniref:Lysophospholipase L1-like esterase n=1 Tax=Pseudarthrobacter siccitolerans TaxID=861266 RepID=A0ABU0PJG9_9MICC|nr:SGNH/GDSL hydrolase family protein [Pseudarthrobacter siccitolerans]MDQ0674108.1 lysophospholipase L1-like esterase [Pseudarthrobacter siccitolerans]